MVITFFEINDIEEERFGKNLTGHTLRFFEEAIQNVEQEKYIDSDVISVFIHSKVIEEIIDQCSNLKLIATRSTGTDHIDLEYAKSQNIQVKNVALYGENTVAEHTFALMLALSRKIHESYIKTAQGNFSTTGLMGFDLKDKTIGIIGGGRIGLHVARMARSFGMHVRVYDIHKDNFMAELINFKYLSLDELLKVSDIISLHVPLNKHTAHMINKETISKMKDGVVIINTARGGLINNADLIAGLESGKIYGAGLDVLEGEEFLFEENISNSPIQNAAKIIVESKLLSRMPNVVITPHNAFNSIEAVHRIIDTTIDNILDSFSN
ncbi:MAG: hydroxyacid dehydrogenase [Clostridia bacterium]|nr:hydroxyacid dehydrogenase [Clostridia bacterium]